MSTEGIHLEGPSGAPLVVLVNSLGSSSQMWSPQLPALTARFRVLRYELPGHGGTQAPLEPQSISSLGQQLVDLIDFAGAPSASVVGLSLGGTIAMWVALNHPSRVDHLVLAATKPVWPPPEQWISRAETVRQFGTVALVDQIANRWFTPAWSGAHPEVKEFVRSMLLSASPEGYASCCEVLARTDLSASLGDVECPTLVIAGRYDNSVSIEEAAGLTRAIAGSQLAVLPGAHLPNWECKEAFTQAVVDHLAGNQQARGHAIRQLVLGEEYVRASSGTGPLREPMRDLAERLAWGEVWTRPGLDLRTRSAVTLAVLTALGRDDELELHLRGAISVGLSVEEVAEILLHSSIYAGLPAANSAFRLARKVLGHEEGAASP